MFLRDRDPPLLSWVQEAADRPVEGEGGHYRCFWAAGVEDPPLT